MQTQTPKISLSAESKLANSHKLKTVRELKNWPDKEGVHHFKTPFLVKNVFDSDRDWLEEIKNEISNKQQVQVAKNNEETSEPTMKETIGAQQFIHKIQNQQKHQNSKKSVDSENLVNSEKQASSNKRQVSKPKSTLSQSSLGYLKQIELSKICPKLASELCPKFDRLFPWPGKSCSYLWVGPDKSHTNFHNDDENNILTVLTGVKRVILFPGHCRSGLFPNDKYSAFKNFVLKLVILWFLGRTFGFNFRFKNRFLAEEFTTKT